MMKRLFAIALLALSTAAFGVTLSPITLINPAGSTAGQAIVSTGSSSAPSWQSITFGVLPQVAANSLLGNATGSAASATAVSVPSCSTSNSALRWTSGTGFSCGTTFALTSGTLAQFAATASSQLAGVISDETGTGGLVFGTAPTINQPVINGVTNGSAAAAGQVGQFVTSTATSVALTNGTAANITSISLTAGDWDVSGQVAFLTASGTTMVGYECGINTTSAAMPANTYDWGALNYSSTGAVTEAISCPVQQINVATTTTVYLVGLAAFTGSTVSASGRIRARRVH
jgi:hypothetical protein